MKKILPPLIVFALLLACNSKKNNDDRGGHYKRPVIDPVWLEKQREKDKANDTLKAAPEKIELVHLSGDIRTRILCGGHAPYDPQDEPESDRNQLPGSPAHNRRFVLREKKTGKRTEFMTNRKARFSVDIPPGEYELMNGRRGVPDEIAFDPNCPEWLNAVLETIVVPDTKQNMQRSFYFEEACDPCDPNARRMP